MISLFSVRLRIFEKRIEDRSGSLFVPEIVSAFWIFSAREYFWFDLASPATSIAMVVSETLSPQSV